MKKVIKNITILRPGGNDTALVPGINWSKKEKRVINDSIMEKYKNVEQVGFVDLSKPDLQMAGGEFCGNATRSATFLTLKGQPGEIKIRVSGAKRLLKAGINKEGKAWSEMPIYKNPKNISREGKYTIVPLYGITLVVIEQKEKFINQETAKKEALKILEKFGLINSVPAAGVMFLYKKNGFYAIEPVVWVQDIKTFFYETACASGTTAIGIFEATRTKKNVVELPVIQPSGMTLFISVIWNKNNFSLAKINGEIKVLRKNIQIETEI